jgi:hypothetical protein
MAYMFDDVQHGSLSGPKGEGKDDVFGGTEDIVSKGFGTKNVAT